MIPFGQWHPDQAALNAPIVTEALNCVPDVAGFRPLKSLSPATGYMGETYLTQEGIPVYIADEAGINVSDQNGDPIELETRATGAYITDESGVYITTGAPVTSSCLGAAVVYDSSGVVSTFGGTSTDLYELISTSQWLPVTRATGGSYATGERWQFGFSGGLVVAVTITEEPQKFLLGVSTAFDALGGTPPKARYITTIGDFVVLAGLSGDERTVHWSGLGNPEHWTPGTQSCDTNTFQNGGSIRGIVGGEVGYVFQAEAVTRMTFVAGGDAIFQFDQVEGGRGLAAPYSLTKLGGTAYYLAADGFYKFDLGGGTSTPLGVGKWARAFVNDLKPGSEQTVIGGVDPVNRYIVWAYNSVGNVSSTSLDKILIYDWTLDEASTASVTVSTLAQSLTQGLTLDTMNGFGSADTLPFSLDSPVWRGGASLLGVFGSDSRLSYFLGPNMAAEFTSGDGGQGQRTLIRGIRPHIDTRSVTAAVACREAEADTVSFNADEAMEDTGVISAWASGFIARARLTVAAGATWTKVTGADTETGKLGAR